MNIEKYQEMLNIIQQNYEKTNLKDSDWQIYFTKKKNEKNIRINNNEADTIVTYKKNNENFYFLIFKKINFHQPISVTNNNNETSKTKYSNMKTD